MVPAEARPLKALLAAHPIVDTLLEGLAESSPYLWELVSREPERLFSLLSADQYRYSTEVQNPLRLIPGVQVTQTGQVGGTTGLSIRGGNINANKVLIDGVPADDIGGAVEFANIDSVGIEKIEVLREPNSALYGSDALAGVVSMTTARGTTRLPLLTYVGDGGNFSTYHNEAKNWPLA